MAEVLLAHQAAEREAATGLEVEGGSLPSCCRMAAAVAREGEERRSRGEVAARLASGRRQKGAGKGRRIQRDRSGGWVNLGGFPNNKVCE